MIYIVQNLIDNVQFYGIAVLIAVAVLWLTLIVILYQRVNELENQIELLKNSSANIERKLNKESTFILSELYAAAERKEKRND